MRDRASTPMRSVKSSRAAAFAGEAQECQNFNIDGVIVSSIRRLARYCPGCPSELVRPSPMPMPFLTAPLFRRKTLRRSTTGAFTFMLVAAASLGGAAQGADTTLRHADALWLDRITYGLDAAAVERFRQLGNWRHFLRLSSWRARTTICPRRFRRRSAPWISLKDRRGATACR